MNIDDDQRLTNLTAYSQRPNDRVTQRQRTVFIWKNWKQDMWIY